MVRAGNKGAADVRYIRSNEALKLRARFNFDIKTVPLIQSKSRRETLFNTDLCFKVNVWPDGYPGFFNREQSEPNIRT